MKQKFIEWFTKNNNGCSPAMEGDRSFVREKTRHMFEAYQAGVAEGEARCAALAAENAGLKAEHELAVQYMEELRANFTMYKKFKCQSQSDVATPATDAFLAEMRAQGVEMLTADRRSEWMDSYIDDANEFAAQLRKGVQS
ncbi:hypothetical protein [Enterobacter hormaechei]|nr:hypothetical protein [Enterobacter hormaechei]KAF0679424.1 hypothetical protein Y59_27860 [Enterobacter hormaechei]